MKHLSNSNWIYSDKLWFEFLFISLTYAPTKDLWSHNLHKRKPPLHWSGSDLGMDCRPVLSDGTQWASPVTAGIWVSIKTLGSGPEKEKVALKGEGSESATRTNSLSSSGGYWGWYSAYCSGGMFSILTGLIETDWNNGLELTLSWFTSKADLPLLINVMWYFTFHNEARVLLFQS